MFFRIGTVQATDPATHRVRVIFDDYDADLVSGWLPFFAWAGAYGLPEVGRQVWCVLRDEGEEDGIVLCETYNDEDTPPESGAGLFYFRFPDGGRIRYDAGTGAMTVEGKGSVTVKAPAITLDGDVSITGDVSVAGNLTADHLKSNSIVEDAAGNVRL